MSRSSGKDTGALSAAATDALLDIKGMSWPDVKRLAAEAHRRRGYETQEPAGVAAGASSSSQLMLTKATQRVLLECKHWKSRKVGDALVRELYGAMAAQNASDGILICLGAFTLEAARFAHFARIELLDGPKLLGRLRPDGTAEESPRVSPLAALR